MHEGAGPLLQGKPFSPGHGPVLAPRRLGASAVPPSFFPQTGPMGAAGP